MKVWIKKLGSQESGYTGDRANQRGTYIFIFKQAWDLFPHLTKTTLNDFTGIRLIILGENQYLGANYVYHNAKHFPKSSLKKKHDERRLYRNKALDRSLKLDKGVIVAFFKDKANNLYVTSFTPDHKEYYQWENLSKKRNIEFQSIPTQLSESLDFKVPYSDCITNLDDVVNESISLSLKRTQKKPLKGDPATHMESLFKNQNDFKDYIRMMYGGKCAIRGESLVNEKFEGLEAAHIMPDNLKGPLLPTNGILMSRDLHDCFERGLFTIDSKNKIKISSTIDRESTLSRFQGKKIAPLEKFKFLEPYKGYTEYHRKNIFRP